MAKLGQLLEDKSHELEQSNKNTNSVNQPSAWNKFSKNQFWIIIQFLDMKQALKLRRVNRRFKQLITQCFPHYLVQISRQIDSLQDQIAQAEYNLQGQDQMEQVRTELGQMNTEQLMQLRIYNRAPPVILQVFSIVHKLFNTHVEKVEWIVIRSELAKPNYIGKILALELHRISGDQIKILSELETIEGGADYAGQVSYSCGLIYRYLLALLSATRSKLFQDIQHLIRLLNSRNHLIRLADILQQAIQ